MRQITQCLNTPLASIYKQASQLGTLTTLVQKYFKSNGLSSVPCSVSRFANGTLMLAVDDPVWATQLRYELPNLRDHLRQQGLHQLTSIQISLRPTTPPPKPVKKKSRDAKISQKTQYAIKDYAEQISYAPLKAALKRLIGH